MFVLLFRAAVQLLYHFCIFRLGYAEMLYRLAAVADEKFVQLRVIASECFLKVLRPLLYAGECRRVALSDALRYAELAPLYRFLYLRFGYAELFRYLAEVEL